MKNFIKLFILGDIGYYNNILKSSISIVTKLMNKNDKIILLGDNFYEEGVENINDKLWMNYIDAFKNIPSKNIHSILGNHDYIKNPNCQINNNYWNTPNFNYKMSFSNHTDLYFIDTIPLHVNHCGISKDKIEEVHNDNLKNIIKNQLNWLKTELNESKDKKKIIFGH